MNRTEFIVATAVILFAAFLLGWFASWIVQKLTRTSRADQTELDRLAHAVHEAEEERDRARAELHEREADLTTQLHQTEAELRAAMEGLKDARREAEEMHATLRNRHAQA